MNEGRLRVIEERAADAYARGYASSAVVDDLRGLVLEVKRLRKALEQIADLKESDPGDALNNAYWAAQVASDALEGK